MSAALTLAQRLASPDAEVRRELAASLRRARGHEEQEALYRLLGDSDWRVRKTAVESLSSDGEPARHAERLIDLVGDEENAGLRNAAVEVLTAYGEAAVPAVLAHLRETQDDDVRIALLNLLHAMGARLDMEAVAPWLNSENKNVAAVAVLCLGRCVGAGAFDLLVKVLQGDDLWLAFHAADALGEIGDARAVEPLAARYREGSLRRSILQALGRIGDLRAVPFLVDALNDPRRVSTDALKALYQIWMRLASRPGEAIAIRKFESLFRENFPAARLDDLIHQGLAGESAMLRAATLEALGWLRSDTSIERLSGYLLDGELRPQAQAALERTGPAARTALAAGLDGMEDSEEALAAALEILGRSGGAEAAGPVAARLTHPSADIRLAAAEALGRMQAPSSLSALLSAVGDENPAVHEGVLRALVSVLSAHPSKEAENALREWLRHEEPAMRSGALAVLMRSAGGQGFLREEAVRASKDEDEGVRRAAFALMGEFPGEDFFEPMAAGLSDESGRVREAAVRALGRLRSPQARETLTGLLGDADMWVRAEAAEALGADGGCGDECLRRLLELLDRDVPPVKIAALRALGNLARPGAAARLMQEADSADEAVRAAAVEALARYGDPATREFLLKRLSAPRWTDAAAAVDALTRRPDAGEAAGSLAALLLTPVEPLLLKKVFTGLARLKAAEALPVAIAYLEREDCRTEVAAYLRAVQESAAPALERMARQLSGRQRQLLETFLHGGR